MTTKSSSQIDAKREEFRKYLEKEGVLESLTKSLVALYETPDKPNDALSFLRNNFVGQDVKELQEANEKLKAENQQQGQDKVVIERKKEAGTVL